MKTPPTVKRSAERTVNGQTIDGSTFVISAWSKRVAGFGTVYGADVIAADGTRQPMRLGATKSIEEALRQAKALLKGLYGSIKWSKALPTGPSYGN
jgi:hypothetical protein